MAYWFEANGVTMAWDADEQVAECRSRSSLSRDPPRLAFLSETAPRPRVGERIHCPLPRHARLELSLILSLRRQFDTISSSSFPVRIPKRRAASVERLHYHPRGASFNETTSLPGLHGDGLCLGRNWPHALVYHIQSRNGLSTEFRSIQAVLFERRA